MTDSRNPEKLTCVAIVVCDDVYRDQQTGKQILVGTFNTVSVPDVPAKLHRLAVQFTLTNGRGRYDLHLAIEHESSGDRVVEMRGPIQIEDPRQILEITTFVQDLPLPYNGRYWVMLLADHEILAQRPFHVITPAHRQEQAQDQAQERPDG